MMRLFRRRLTFANVTSLIALFVALGGTSYAALTITGKNVKNSSLTGADIKNSSLSTKDVKNGSLLSQDFKAGQLPQGPKGDKGDKGDTGLQGPPGTNGTNGATNVTVRQGTLISVANGATGSVTASCLAGERATGGGSSVSGSTGWSVIDSFPTPGTTGSTPTGWRVDAHNGTGSANNLVAIVVCASP